MVTQDGLVRLGSRVFSAADGIPAHEYGNGEFTHTPPAEGTVHEPEPSALTDTAGLS
jgi:acetylglutamate kinase